MGTVMDLSKVDIYAFVKFEEQLVKLYLGVLVAEKEFIYLFSNH